MIASANRSNSNTVLTDIAGRVDGLAIASGTIPDADLRRIAARLPVVVLSEASADDRLNWVSVDNAGGMRELTEHLIRAHGLRDLQFVGSLYTSDRLERFDAFRATSLAAGLEVPRAPLPVTGDYRAMIADLIRQNALPDAFVCTHDEIALALMDALRDANIDVPGQVAVTGFDGIVAGRLSSPELTTVRQPMVAVGASAVRILIDRMEHPDEPTTSQRLPVRLVLRGSCGCSVA